MPIKVWFATLEHEWDENRLNLLTHKAPILQFQMPSYSLQIFKEL